MSTDKTLADAQPGGRVRLGNGLPEAVAQALATVNEAANDARHAGNYKVANALVAARVTLSKQLLALSAQPSPGGQGDVGAKFEKAWREAADIFSISRAAAQHIWNAALAARQPVYVQGCDELRARTEDERAAYMEGLEEGKKIAARQPVGEPTIVAHRYIQRHQSAEHSVWLSGDADETYVEAERQGLGRIERAYACPPAQAVDLERFRGTVKSQYSMTEWMHRCGFVSAEKLEESKKNHDHLMALIDSKAVGNG